MMDWRAVRGVICDMDGVLWRGHKALPGLVEWFQFLAERGLEICLATNNSTQTPQDYVSKLEMLGVAEFPAARIITSSSATAQVALTRYGAQSEVYVVGEVGLRKALSSVGLYVLADDETPQGAVRAVVVGLDRTLSYEKAKRATRFILGGADFIGTNPDATFPMPDGLAPGAGSVIAMIQTASGVAPTLIGKPQPAMYEVALNEMGLAAGAVLMVGDRLDTDIWGAQALGMQTALVLSGVSSEAQGRASTPPPNWMGAGLPALMADWGS